MEPLPRGGPNNFITLCACECEFHLVNGCDPKHVPVDSCHIHRTEKAYGNH